MKKFMVIAALAAMLIACASKEEKYVKDYVAACEAKDVDALIKLAENADTTMKFTPEQEKQMEEAMKKAGDEFQNKVLEAALKAEKK